MEAKDIMQCPDSIFRWGCLVQMKYRTKGRGYDFKTAKARCYKDEAKCSKTFLRRIASQSRNNNNNQSSGQRRRRPNQARRRQQQQRTGFLAGRRRSRYN